MRNDVNYSHVRYFDDFENVLSDNNLIQLIEFPTWSRIVNDVLIESILHHIVLKNLRNFMTNRTPETPRVPPLKIDKNQPPTPHKRSYHQPSKPQNPQNILSLHAQPTHYGVQHF